MLASARQAHPPLKALIALIAQVGALVACSRREPRAVVREVPVEGVPPHLAILPDARVREVPVEGVARDAAGVIDVGAAVADTSSDGMATRPEPATRRIRVAPDRHALVVWSPPTDRPARLLTMIHGVCTPPSYVCGAWKSAAAAAGVLVCPEGNTTCGPDGTGGPTWEEPFPAIDDDVEVAVHAAIREVPGRVTRSGSVLAGFSRGGSAAVILAIRHPGRWPFLIVNEADVDLTVPMLRDARVRAVALIAGEWGTQLAGERKTAEALAKAGFPIKLWIMPKAGHFYSPDIDSIMKEALDFVVSYDDTSSPVP